jgi:N-acetylglucosaminyldiphosphoundecaprenol N-acetyl-beta-D-mannosaminyltransferase
LAADKQTRVAQRYDIMRVGIDLLDEGEIASAIDELVARDKPAQIVLARWWDFMRARRSRRYRQCLSEADLVLPVSRSLVVAGSALRGVRLPRYMPFDFVIRALGALEERSRSLYVLGGSHTAIKIVEQNLRETFPGIRFVGRHAGRFRKQREVDIITAIRKAHPDFVLIGSGVPSRERWVSRHRGQLSPSIFLFSSEVFDIFADRRRRGSRTAFKRGLDFVPDLLRRPWRALRFFAFVWFLVLFGFYRLFGR